MCFSLYSASISTAPVAIVYFFAMFAAILTILAILTCETQQSLEGRRSARKEGEAVKGFRKRDRHVLQGEPLRNTNTKYKDKMKYKHKKIQQQEVKKASESLTGTCSKVSLFKVTCAGEIQNTGRQNEQYN